MVAAARKLAIGAVQNYTATADRVREQTNKRTAVTRKSDCRDPDTSGMLPQYYTEKLANSDNRSYKFLHRIASRGYAGKDAISPRLEPDKSTNSARAARCNPELVEAVPLRPAVVT